MYRIIGADGRKYGPVSADQLREWIAQHRADAAMRVRAEGTNEWKALGSLPEFSLLFARSTQTGSTPSPVPGPISPVAPFSGSQHNAFAVTGFVMGIIGLTIGLCCCSGMPFNFLGLIFSIIGLVQINDEPQRYHGKGIAIAGLVLSIVSLLILVLSIMSGLRGGWPGLRHHHYRL